MYYYITHACEKWGKFLQHLLRKSHSKFSNAYDGISTYPFLAYLPFNIFTVCSYHLPSLHREALQCHFDSSN